MKEKQSNIYIDARLYKQLQATAKQMKVPEALLVKRLLWQFISSVNAS